MQTDHPRRNAASPPPWQRGIFLIELVVTLAVVAVLVGLAVPGFTRLLREYQVRTAAQDLLAELGWARAEAMRRGTGVFLRIRPIDRCPAEQACGWDIVADLNHDAVLQDSDLPLRHYDLPASVAIQSVHEGNLRFDALGVGWPRANNIVVARTGAATGEPGTRILCLAFGNRIRIAQGALCND